MSNRSAVVAMLVLAAAAAFGPGAARAAAGPGAVYFETNTTPKNFVQVFSRNANGSLRKGPLVRTGGVGSNTASPFASDGFPLLDSANSVVLSRNGKLLFVVNAGSNTISTFTVTAKGLVLTDHRPSRGTLPVSVATATKNGKTLVYVVNQRSGNIAGFTAAANGKLAFLPGSVRSLVTSGPNGVAAMIGFDASASTLTVSERGAIFSPLANSFLGTGPDLIDTFKIDAKGLPGEPIRNASAGEDPFGFAYTKSGRLFMTDSGVKGTVSTYGLNTGTTELSEVDHQPASGSAPCWVVLSSDDRYAFVTNSLSGTVSRFGLAADGHLSLLGTTSTTNNAALDEDSSDDGRFLYVLSTKVINVTKFVSTRVDAYRIGADGSLTLVGQTGQLPFPGASGLAAS
jgi:6-phosphogluconolactonase